MDLLLNEVLYDPDGADGGYEFVEIVARPGTSVDAGLAGWTLETGNGADGQWRVAWVGSAGDRLHAGLSLIGESGVEPRPHVVTDLDLQNGPDACRLRSPSGEIDVVGWGAGLPNGFFERAPAPDVTGVSLVRLPDGVDTDDNAADFRGMPASPGDFNAPPTLLLFDSWEPPSQDLAVGSPGTFIARVRNAGRLPWQDTLPVRCRLHRSEILSSWTSDAPLLPGETRELRAEAWPPPGFHLPVTTPEAPTVAGPWRGVGDDLAISEVFAHPATEDVEWVELRSVSDEIIDLGLLRFQDAVGSGGKLSGDLPAHGFVVVTPDAAAFSSRWSVPDGVTIVTMSPWPAINHTGQVNEVTERMSVIAYAHPDSTGTDLALAALPGGLPESISWERISLRLSGADVASWAESLDPQGATPGRENSRRSEGVITVAGSLVVTPTPFLPRRDGAVLIVLRPSPPVSSCRLTVHDSAGRVVTDLAPWLAEGGEHRAVWDGKSGSGEPMPLGLYIVSATAPGAAPRSATVVLAR